VYQFSTTSFVVEKMCVKVFNNKARSAELKHEISTFDEEMMQKKIKDDVPLSGLLVRASKIHKLHPFDSGHLVNRPRFILTLGGDAREQVESRS
jgi:hypothetical protein